jgi:hypothetical protein
MCVNARVAGVAHERCLEMHEGKAGVRPVTWVRINEFEGGDWAIGGKALRAADVHALAAGKAA